MNEFQTSFWARLALRALCLLFGIAFGALTANAFIGVPIVLCFGWMAIAKSDGITREIAGYFMLGFSSLLCALVLAMMLAAQREGFH